MRELLGPRLPLVVAPMAGGPSTPSFVAAVSAAGALGFLAAGYRTAADVRAQIAELRTRSEAPFGVNVFVPGPAADDPAALTAYAARLTEPAARLGVTPGDPRWDDDEYAAKIDVLASEAVPLVSFTFGLPSSSDIARLRAAGSRILVTVTSEPEARAATDLGVDGLVVQGAEAGGHRGTFTEDATAPPGAGAVSLLSLLPRVREATSLPLIAAGGLMDGDDIASVLALGAVAAQLGTAFLACPEAGTGATHREALVSGGFTETGFTRAFTGRSARGLVNDFMRLHDGPALYPQVHHLTRPLRQAAAAVGDAESLHLWAGTGWKRVRPLPVEALMKALEEELAGRVTPGSAASV